MKKNIDVEIVQDGVCFIDNIVYSQTLLEKHAYHKSRLKQLHLSVIKPYDSSKRQPCLVGLCGGGWRHTEVNDGIAEYGELARAGFTIAFVEYTCFEELFPNHLIEIKQAIRFLRAHADEFCIDKDRIAIWGGSAGAHLAAMIGVTGNTREFDKGEYLEESSAVQAACTWYLPSNLIVDRNPDAEFTQTMLLGYTCAENPEGARKICPSLLVDEDTPPFIMFHGTADKRVPYAQSEEMYDNLVAKGIPAELYLINGAAHAGLEFIQPEVRDLMVKFFRKYL